MIILLIYVLLFIGAMIAYKFVSSFFRPSSDFTSLKTVTFGDESAVRANRAASIISIIAIFFIWSAFTGSSLIPSFLHAPGPFVGKANFTYEATLPSGDKDQGTVEAIVHPLSEKPETPSLGANAEDGFANDNIVTVGAWRSKLISSKTLIDSGVEAKITSVGGKSISPGETVNVGDIDVRMTSKGSLSVEPEKGWQMEAIWLPAPEAVVGRLIEISLHGYQNVTLFENLGWSLYRVILGFIAGCIVGIPLGYAMGLNDWFRGWFDPIVEFMRPVPPLALIPLIIIWFGIWETGKISLLFLAALWIMTIAARAGVSGVKISKVHAAYSLGASKRQIMSKVIVPNSLPEIFTGARVAMGVCWGTVVAAELVAAEKGAGKMIIAASKFQNTDIVIMGIILIGIIGYGIDILMRIAENWLVPWKGKG